MGSVAAAASLGIGGDEGPLGAAVRGTGIGDRWAVEGGAGAAVRCGVRMADAVAVGANGGCGTGSMQHAASSIAGDRDR